MYFNLSDVSKGRYVPSEDDTRSCIKMSSIASRCFSIPSLSCLLLRQVHELVYEVTSLTGDCYTIPPPPLK